MRINRLKRYLGQLYPYYWKQSVLYRMAFVLAILTFAFTFAFEPFVVFAPEHKMNFFWICAVHGLVPGVVSYLFFSMVNWKGVVEENWTISHELTHIFLLLLGVGVGNFVIRDLIYDNPQNWSIRFLFEELRNALLVGGLIFFTVLSINFNRLLNKNKQVAAQLRSPQQPAASEQPAASMVAITAQVKTDHFVLDVEKILFVRSAGNYVEFYLKSEAFPDILLKRLSMKELEAQLAHFPYLLKTHRAYLVNLRSIKKVMGNAQGYTLAFEGTKETAVVARGNIGLFNRTLKKQAGDKTNMH